MPALLPIIAIIAVFVFISAHAATTATPYYRNRGYRDRDYRSSRSKGGYSDRDYRDSGRSSSRSDSRSGSRSDSRSGRYETDGGRQSRSSRGYRDR